MKLTSAIIICVSIVLAAYVAMRYKKIDLPGTVLGALLAFLIWFSGGLVSLVSLFVFFILGSFASSWKRSLKIQYDLEQEKSGKRGASNVLANGGVAGILAMISFFPSTNSELLSFMTLASFATACSDTFSSEFGNVYGKKFFNIISFKRESRGVDGAVSSEGLFFGLIGSLVIALATLLFQGDTLYLIMITVCGLVGNVIDSILGATLQQKGILNNHQVNFLATLSGAIFGMFFYFIIIG